MIQRGGPVVVCLLADVKQVTIKTVVTATIASGTLVYTDEYAIYSRLEEWGYGHKSVCHGNGEYARDEDGDGFHEVHVNTMEGVLVATALLATSSPRYTRRLSSCYFVGCTCAL